MVDLTAPPEVNLIKTLSVFVSFLIRKRKKIFNFKTVGGRQTVFRQRRFGQGKGSRKKIKLFFSGPATKRGGGKALPLRKKNVGH